MYDFRDHQAGTEYHSRDGEIHDNCTSVGQFGRNWMRGGRAEFSCYMTNYLQPKYL